MRKRPEMATPLNLNTLQPWQFFSFSLCKCFSTHSLHNSNSCFHFFAFPSPKHALTSITHVHNNSITAVFSSLNRNFSAKTLETGNDYGNTCSGPSLSYSNEEIVKERLNLGKRNEKGSGNSAVFSSLNHNSSAELLGFRNDDGNSCFGRREVSKGVVDDRKGRKSNVRIDFGKGKGKGNGKADGVSSSIDERVGFDCGRRWENFNGDSGWGREHGSENYGKTSGKIDFGKRSEVGNGVLSSKPSGGKWVRRVEGSLGSVALENENRGQKGSGVSLRTRDEKSARVAFNRNVDGNMTRGRKSDNDKMKRKDRSSKKKGDSPEFQLRIGLDRCSKLGDVMGAISLYDSAVKQGVKIGQHQFTVLLYLCSSAAMGVIRPAKSGSGSRTSGKVASDDSGEEEDEGDGDTDDEDLGVQDQNEKLEMNEIRVSDDVKKYALQKGFEVYERMCLDEVPMNEAALTSVARMAMAMGNGDMAFDIVNQMKSMGISPKLRSYNPALSVFSNNGEVEKAFSVEKHMLENGVEPEEPELEALLSVSIQSGKADRVYYVLHKLRTNVRSVSPYTAELIEKWFRSREASRVGKRKWDVNMLAQTMETVGGGWHGIGWLGSGKWVVSRTSIGSDGLCKCCGERLALIDLDPQETENFAESVASIAMKRVKYSGFQKFQKWLDYYGPFEAVVDAANIGLYSQRKFKPSKVNAVVNGIRPLLPSKKCPLIILHNKRVIGEIDQPVNRAVLDRWRNADALYATPTGSNDDWYWLYAAIKFKCLLVTNDEMRDHTFHLLGNDFFPKWKERHQVRFSFSETGPVFHMPPPCSVVIQESNRGLWHIPIASEHQSEEDRIWLCISRPKVLVKQDPEVGTGAKGGNFRA